MHSSLSLSKQRTCDETRIQAGASNGTTIIQLMDHRLAKPPGVERRLVCPGEHLPWKKAPCWRSFLFLFCFFKEKVTEANNDSDSPRSSVIWIGFGVAMALWKWLLACVLHWCDSDSANVGLRGTTVTTPPSRPPHHQCNLCRHCRNY